jgi:murein L,D-transpeptidase YcbB/YkuD
MKADASYLRKNNMEIVQQSDSIPVIKQLPGKDNPLGKVKFLFPNTHSIYLHDTPDKTLFNKSNRTLSHGCIRVADANRLTAYLLKDSGDWNEEKIKTAMNSGKEQTVELKQVHPVAITYYTVWVDNNGTTSFRPDVYGHDKEAIERMFL